MLNKLILLYFFFFLRNVVFPLDIKNQQSSYPFALSNQSRTFYLHIYSYYVCVLGLKNVFRWEKWRKNKSSCAQLNFADEAHFTCTEVFKINFYKIFIRKLRSEVHFIPNLCDMNAINSDLRPYHWSKWYHMYGKSFKVFLRKERRWRRYIGSTER